AHAEEDRARKEAAEARNEADSLIYSAEKTVSDLGDKLSSDQKERINRAKDALKEVLEKGEIGPIKEKTEELTKVLHEVSAQVYQATAASEGAQSAGESGPGAGAKPDDDVIDADFTVSDDKKE